MFEALQDWCGTIPSVVGPDSFGDRQVEGGGRCAYSVGLWPGPNLASRRWKQT